MANGHDLAIVLGGIQSADRDPMLGFVAWLSGSEHSAATTATYNGRRGRMKAMSVMPAHAGAARLIWERWTIDEILDDIVRLAACRARDTRPIEALRSATEFGKTGETDVDEVAREVRRQTMDGELRALVRWGDEVAWHVPRAALGRFLERRDGKPGLPGVRPLREGDVFWIVVGRDRGRTVQDVGVRANVAQTEDLFAPFVEAGADVWDVTAAARQVVKRRSAQALERQGREGGGG